MKKMTRKAIEVEKIYRRLRQKKSKRKSPTNRRFKAKTRWWDKDLEAPESLDILDNDARNKTLRFIDSIHRAIQDGSHHIRLRFNKTLRMYGPATLLLRAELHRLRERFPKIAIRCSLANDPSVNLTLSQLNILSVCGQTSPYAPNQDQAELFKSWRSMSGKGSDGEKCDPFLIEYETYLHDSLSQELYDGLTEAMTNTRHHAYPGKALADIEDTEWWIFSQETEEHLLISICDLGVGIPKSLPSKRPKLWETILNLNDLPSDSEIIQCTIDNKISSTGEDYRGKGLTQLASVAESLQGAGFMIFSDKGLYAKAASGVKVKDFEKPIGGTIATWKLPKIEHSQ